MGGLEEQDVEQGGTAPVAGCPRPLLLRSMKTTLTARVNVRNGKVCRRRCLRDEQA